MSLLAFANTVVRDFTGGAWRTDERISSQSFHYPWEIRRYAHRQEMTKGQILPQLERFHRIRTLDRRLARARGEDRNAQHYATVTVVLKSIREVQAS